MRVLVMTNLYPNPYDPTRATFNRQQIRALAQEHAVRVISPIAWVDEWRARSAGKPAIPADRRLQFDGLTVEHPRYLYPPKMLRSWYGHFYRWSVAGMFQRALREFRPDVVLAPWAYPDGWAAVELGHATGLPVVLKIHGCDVRWGLSQNPSRMERTKQAVREADGIIAVSRDLAAICEQFGAASERVHVLYDGVDAERFCPGSRADARRRLGLPAEAKLIVCVAALEPVKALDRLIDACAQLQAQGRTFLCRIIGKGPLADVLAAQIAARGLTGTVELLGARPHDTLPDWYRAADVFVLPSLSEGVPCVLLEAMACGAPFVATQVGGIPEVAALGEGQLIPPSDVHALAAALEREFAQPSPSRPSAIRSHADAARELAGILQSHLPTRTPLHANAPQRDVA